MSAEAGTETISAVKVGNIFTEGEFNMNLVRASL